MTKTTKIDCPKCFGGRRFLNWSHVAGGVCFTCGGVGSIEVSNAPRRVTVAADAAAYAVVKEWRPGAYAVKYSAREWADALEVRAEIPGSVIAKFDGNGLVFRDGTPVPVCYDPA